MANHAHDVAAGVQAEGTRLLEQFHIVNLSQQAVALAAVAAMAAGDKVLPC